MKTLLFITEIYNNLENIDKSEFIDIIKKLEKIAKEEKDDIILLSISDSTNNRDVLMYYYRTILQYIEDKNIFLGYQFLGDTYYKNIFSLPILYDTTREDQINKYIDYLKNYSKLNIYTYNDLNENKLILK